MRLKDNKNFQNFITFTCSLCVTVLFYFVLTKSSQVSGAWHAILSIIKPFIYGIAIAYVMNPMVKRLDKFLIKWLGDKKKGFIRFVSVMITLVLILLLLYLLIIMVIPQLIDSVNILIKQVPSQSQEFMNHIRLKVGDNKILLNYVNQVYNQMGASVSKFVQVTVLPYLTNIVSGVGAGVIGIANVLKNVLVGIFAAIYILLNKELFLKQARLVVYTIFNKHNAEIFLEEVLYTDKMFSGFISGKVVDSLIIGVLCGIFCAIVGMPSGLLVSVLVGITNIIPFFGPYIGAIPCIFLIFIQSPTMAAIFVVFIIILQQIDGNLIGPMILGDSTGLSGFWVLFSILVFGGMFGFVGMIVGVPVFAVIYDIIKKIVNFVLIKRGRQDLLDEYKEFKDAS